MRRHRVKCILVVMVLLALTNCRSKKNFEYGVNPTETLVYNLGQEPPTLDWNRIEDATSRIVVDNIMEPLVGYDYSQQGAPLTKGLAVKWDSSEEGRIWTIHLRRSVKWTDGVLFESQHVVDSFERLLSPKTGGMGSDDFFVIKNAEKFNQGRLQNFGKVGVKKIDAFTVQFTLERPLSFFPYILSLPQSIPIRLDIIKKFGDRWTLPENIVTLGAYKLTRWKHDSYILLSRNPNYFGDAGFIKNVLMRMIREDNTAVNLFETSRLDVVSSLPSDDLARIQKKKEYVSFNNSCVAFLVFNTQLPPLDNVLIRRALALGIDREPIIKILGGGRKANQGWLPEGLLGYDRNIGLAFDPQKARQLIRQAGYKSGAEVPPIELLYNTSENYRQMFENLQAQLKENLGIRLILRNLEWKSYLGQIRTKMPHIHRMGWIGVYPDPDVMMRPLMGSASSINPSWSHNEYKRLVTKAMSEFSPLKRATYYQKASRILTEDEIPVFNIYTCAQQYLISDRIAFYPLNKEARELFRFVKFK